MTEQSTVRREVVWNNATRLVVFVGGPDDCRDYISHHEQADPDIRLVTLSHEAARDRQRRR